MEPILNIISAIFTGNNCLGAGEKNIRDCSCMNYGFLKLHSVVTFGVPNSKISKCVF